MNRRRRGEKEEKGCDRRKRERRKERERPRKQHDEGSEKNERERRRKRREIVEKQTVVDAKRKRCDSVSIEISRIGFEENELQVTSSPQYSIPFEMAPQNEERDSE